MDPAWGLGICGSGFRVWGGGGGWGSGFGVEGFGVWLRHQCTGVRVWVCDLGFSVRGLGSRVHGFGV